MNEPLDDLQMENLEMKKDLYYSDKRSKKFEQALKAAIKKVTHEYYPEINDLSADSFTKLAEERSNLSTRYSNIVSHLCFLLQNEYGDEECMKSKISGT